MKINDDDDDAVPVRIMKAPNWVLFGVSVTKLKSENRRGKHWRRDEG
jgi:hypothetical protein